MNDKSNRLNQLLLMLADRPDDDFLIFALAKEYEKQEDFENAFSQYLKLQQINPDYVGCYFHLAKLYEKQESFETALVIYEKGMQVAKSLGDQHAFSELSNAKLNLELEEGL